MTTRCLIGVVVFDVAVAGRRRRGAGRYRQRECERRTEKGRGRRGGAMAGEAPGVDAHK